MVWGAIWVGGRSDLVIMEKQPGHGFNAKSYIETLEIGLVGIYEPGIVFQQDNARIHVAKIV